MHKRPHLLSKIFYRRRIMRHVLHSLRHQPLDWKQGQDWMRTMTCEPFAIGCGHLHVGGLSLRIPFLWRGRIRRAIRRAVWAQANRLVHF